MTQARQKISTADRIANKVRAKIRSGEFPAGSRLPSTAELARQWSTYVPAVQGALARLAAEGLLDRRPCLGTFVRERGTALSRIGILAAGRMWDDHAGFYFHRQVFLEVHEILASRGVHTTVWFEHRRDEKTSRPLPAVVRAVRQKEVQAIIALNADAHTTAWLSALPVPVTGLDRHLASHVLLDQGSFFKLALRQLRAQGCKTVGLISPVPSTDTAYHESFHQAVLRARLKTRGEWIRSGKPYPQSMEQFGYDQIQALSAQPERPRGVVVHPDIVARGALLAISTLGVRVPQDFCLVFHRNIGVPFVCPLPVAFVESSCRECAEALVRQLELLHRGLACPVRVVGYRLAPVAAQAAPAKQAPARRRSRRL